jgi:hypothetical protein
MYAVNVSKVWMICKRQMSCVGVMFAMVSTCGCEACNECHVWMFCMKWM